MLGKIWEKCVNYETVSYLICGFLTTAVDFVVYGQLRRTDLSVEISQGVSWVAAVLFAYVVNKLIVFRNYDFHPSYLAKEGGAFVAARAFSGGLTWLMMVVLVRLKADGGFIYEMICKFTVCIINMCLNYVFSKVWIFKKKPE